VRTARLNRILGTELTAGEVKSLLDPIGFAATPAGDDLAVTVPSWRYDSAVEIDVIEEAARHHGYARIGKTLPPSAHAGRLTERQLERRSRAACWWDGAWPRPCRCPSSPPATWPAAACQTTASRSPTRWWPRSRCCGRRCCRAW
jgi:hypothetical protein